MLIHPRVASPRSYVVKLPKFSKLATPEVVHNSRSVQTRPISPLDKIPCSPLIVRFAQTPLQKPKHLFTHFNSFPPKQQYPLSLPLPLHQTKLNTATMAASLTISRLLIAPRSLSTTTTTKPSLFSITKPFSSTFSYSPLSLKPPTTHLKPLSFSSKPISAAISIDDTLPNSTLSYLDAANDVQTLTVSDLTKSKKTILFAVPGAFTPTCSQKHVPGFVEKSSELKAKGVDVIACVSVNDVFVMKAWKESLGVGDEVLMLSDGNGEFTRALGVELDLSDKPVGLGVRSRRYSILAEDGVVKVLNLEEGGAFTSSGADDILKLL